MSEDGPQPYIRRRERSPKDVIDSTSAAIGSEPLRDPVRGGVHRVRHGHGSLCRCNRMHADENGSKRRVVQTLILCIHNIFTGGSSIQFSNASNLHRHGFRASFMKYLVSGPS